MSRHYHEVSDYYRRSSKNLPLAVSTSERDTSRTFPMSHRVNHPSPPHDDLDRVNPQNRRRIAVAVSSFPTSLCPSRTRRPDHDPRRSNADCENSAQGAAKGRLNAAGIQVMAQAAQTARTQMQSQEIASSYGSAMTTYRFRIIQGLTISTGR